MKRLADQSLYEILEVREDALTSEISAACDRARDIYGPGSLATYSLMTPEEAELLTRRIDEARATLLDPDARARYDGTLRRSGEAVAAAGGAGAMGSGASLPPVIPALKLPEASAPREVLALAEQGGPAQRVETPEPVAAPDPAALAAPAEAGEAAETEEGEADETAGAAEPVAAPEDEEELPPARPAILLAAAIESAGVPEEASIAPPELPSPKPILLQREVPPPPPPAPAQGPPAEAPAPPAVPFPTVPDGAWTGEALRQAREARGLTVQQIAERTKVTRHHIENIEEERFGALPAAVYLRGILLSIARELRLDGQRVARAYLDRAAAAQGSRPR